MDAQGVLQAVETAIIKSTNVSGPFTFNDYIEVNNTGEILEIEIDGKKFVVKVEEADGL